jgi:glycosyltransferase involved in cell wall biosynthesis
MVKLACAGKLGNDDACLLAKVHTLIRVTHVVGSLHPSTGGPSRTVTQLCDALASRQDVEVTLLSQSFVGEPVVPSISSAVTRKLAQTKSLLALKLGIPAYHELTQMGKQRSPTLLHCHGVWIPVNHWATRMAVSRKIPLIIQPRGMLEPWALNQEALKKQLAMALFQRRDLNAASLFIATASMEYESIRALGLRQPVAVIPNGVLVGPVAEQSDTAFEPLPKTSDRSALFLSRVHPKKGLLNLLNAWAAVSPQGWRLQIAGPDQGGHLAEVAALAHKLGIDNAVEYLGELAGDAKARAYLHADLFVLPTFSENFGVVVAEALAHGLPVITTRGAPWADLQTHACGWWIDIGVAPLVDALREAIGLSDEERQAMGKRGRDYVRRYDWADIAGQMIDAYKWILGQVARPDCVRID